MKKVNNYLAITSTLLFFISCNSLDENVKEYAAINNEIDQIYEEISIGKINEETGIAEISDLKQKLEAFDPEVYKQYYKEEEIRQEIETERRKFKKKSRIDSIKQAKIAKNEERELKKREAKKAREEDARLKAEALQRKREVAEMIAAEEEAERNYYLEQLQNKGLFLVEFDGERYEVNIAEWNSWKTSEDYDSAESAAEYRAMFNAMGSAKANKLAGSLYRTISNGIAREGITFKAIQGIQVYNVLTIGETKFD